MQYNIIDYNHYAEYYLTMTSLFLVSNLLNSAISHISTEHGELD